VGAEAGEFMPVLSGVCGAEQSGVFYTRIDGIWICERRLEVPDALKLPGMGSAVVPLMSSGNSVVGEFIAYWFPSLASVV
jgi:hypothetical protein